MSLPPDSFGPDHLAAALPEPTPEDPASLRDDIIDELADHLRLSLDRELVNTGDEAVARRRVLERFGDPRPLARKLWWDALKGHVMRNRMVTAAAVVAMIVSLAAVGGVYGLASSLAASNDRMAAQTAQLIAGQQAMLATLAELTRQSQAQLAKAELAQSQANAPKPRVATDWRPFSVRVVSEKTRTPVTATCLLWPSKGTHTVPTRIEVKTDRTGLAEFGTLPPGVARLSVYSDAQGGWQWTDPEFWLRPDGPELVEIEYPETGGREGRLLFRGLEQLRVDTRSQVLSVPSLCAVSLFPMPFTVSGKSWLRMKRPGEFLAMRPEDQWWSRVALVDGAGQTLASDVFLVPQSTSLPGMGGRAGGRRALNFPEIAWFKPPRATNDGLPLPEGRYLLLGTERVDDVIDPAGTVVTASGERVAEGEHEIVITSGQTAELNLEGLFDVRPAPTAE
jgi:hypothetical protein